MRKLPVHVPLERARESAFSYRCSGCGSCCFDKSISVNPYELLRLARSLGLTTTVALASFVSAEDMTLRRRADGSCIFLRGTACGVHAGRPAACRVYPLAVVQAEAGSPPKYGEIERPAASRGAVGDEGTVAGYLAAQGLPSFDAPFAAYRAVLSRLVGVLEVAEESEVDPAIWVDADAALGAEAPEDPERAWPMHVALLHRALDGIERGASV